MFSEKYNLRDMFSKYAIHIPFLAMIGNLIGFIIFFSYYMNGKKESELMCTLDNLLKHITETPLLFILLIYAFIEKPTYISKLSLRCIIVLWFINLPYIIFSFDVDIYFFISVICVYIVFLVLSLAKITKRI